MTQHQWTEPETEQAVAMWQAVVLGHITLPSSHWPAGRG